MRLVLNRIYKGPEYTIGRMYNDVNGQMVYLCDTLEPTDRGLTKTHPESSVKARKVNGKTAIPLGTYAITLKVQSPKFRLRYWARFCDGYLPTILGVPCFDRVLIHVGNNPSETQGCVLTGFNTVKGKVMRSAEAFRKVYGLLKEADDRGQTLSLTIQ